jgi:hypothetical protein
MRGVVAAHGVREQWWLRALLADDVVVQDPAEPFDLLQMLKDVANDQVEPVVHDQRRLMNCVSQSNKKGNAPGLPPAGMYGNGSNSALV